MAKSVTPDAISTLLANPSPDSSSEVPEIVVQVLDLKPTGSKYMFTASDGKMKLKALLQSSLSSEVMSGNIQNLGLIRIVDYTVNDIPTKNEKFLIVIKCEVVSPAIEEEIKTEVKIEETGIILKPKQEMYIKGEARSEGTGINLRPKQELVAKSAAQIVHEQNEK
ncbi:Replication protein A 70 kDa DNA-binding subunit B [Sarracenia purpurea var. burkii]